MIVEQRENTHPPKESDFLLFFAGVTLDPRFLPPRRTLPSSPPPLPSSSSSSPSPCCFPPSPPPTPVWAPTSCFGAIGRLASTSICATVWHTAEVWKCGELPYHTVQYQKHTMSYHNTLPYHTIDTHLHNGMTHGRGVEMWRASIPYRAMQYHNNTIPYHNTIPYQSVPVHTTPYHIVPYHTIP